MSALLVAALLSASPALPKDSKALAAVLKSPKSLEHLHVYVVDELCLKKGEADAPPHASVSGSTVGDQQRWDYVLAETKPALFKQFVAWAKRAAPAERKVLFGRKPVSQVDKTPGFIAVCLEGQPVLEPKDLSRVTNKTHPELDEKRYRVAVVSDGLAKLTALPATVQRIAFVYDDTDVLGVFDVAQFRDFDGFAAVVNVAEF